MKLVYIAGPYRASTPWEVEQNIRKAESIGFVVASQGCVPIIPHSMYRFYNGLFNDEFWLNATIEILKKCDAAVFLSGWDKSEGSMIESEIACDLNIPITFYCLTDNEQSFYTRIISMIKGLG